MRKRSATLAAATVLAAASLALAGCTGGSSDDAGGTPSDVVGDVLNVGVILVPAQWDPAKFDWTEQLELQQAAYDTLIHLQPDGTYAPGLATEWSYTSPTEFTLTLREGVTFSDGTALDAAAVKANLDHARTTTGPRTSQLAAISEVQTDGDLGVTIDLSTPNPDLPLILSMAMGMMASPAALAAGTLDTAPVGAGPYVLDAAQTVVNDHYTFTKNPDYWDAGSIHYNSLVFKLITDYTASLNALRSGQIAMALGQPTTASAAEAAGDTVVTTPGSVVSLVLQDREGQLVPALGDVRVRQAMNYAIDRAALAASLLPGSPTSQQFQKGTSMWDEAINDTYDQDLDKAKSLMADAGYANGFDLPIGSFPLNDPALQVIASDLAKIGITVQIQSVPIADYVTLRSSTQWPAWIAQIVGTGSGYLDALNVLPPDSRFNPFHSTNADITAGLTAIATATGPDSPAYAQLAEAVQDQAWFLPVVQIDRYYYYDPKVVSGVQWTPGQAVPFIYTWAPAS